MLQREQTSFHHVSLFFFPSFLPFFPFVLILESSSPRVVKSRHLARSQLIRVIPFIQPHAMCGPEVTGRPRGGALAALSAPRNDSLCHLSLQGDLAFHTPGQPGSTEATHARFTPSERGGLTLGDVDSLRVVIQYVLWHRPHLHHTRHLSDEVTVQ